MEASAEIFTRGGQDAGDNRGQSMVQQHAEKLQKAKEANSLAKLRALMPHIGGSTLDLALRECQWDSDRAAALLRMFAIAHAKDLGSIQKEQKERKAISDTARNRDSDATERNSSDEDSDDSDDERRRRRHDRKRKKEGRKSEKRASRKEKKKKKHKKRSRSTSRDIANRKGAVGEEYGKHGIIRETDMYAKRPEFMLWAAEVKKIDVEAMPKFEEKELFRDYMEDYNTSTLPHEKYYDNELYERRRAAEKRRKGGDGEGERTAFEDEEELRRQRAAERAQEQADRLRAAYAELQTTDKARDMREQELMRARMGLAYRMGDTNEAQRLAARLAPDDPAHPQR